MNASNLNYKSIYAYGFYENEFGDKNASCCTKIITLVLNIKCVYNTILLKAKVV